MIKNLANFGVAGSVRTRDFVEVLKHLRFDCYDKDLGEFHVSPNLDENVFMMPEECASFPSGDGFSVKGLQHGRSVKVQVFDGDTGEAVAVADTKGVKRKKKGRDYEPRAEKVDDIFNGDALAVELCA